MRWKYQNAKVEWPRRLQSLTVLVKFAFLSLSLFEDTGRPVFLDRFRPQKQWQFNLGKNWAITWVSLNIPQWIGLRERTSTGNHRFSYEIWMFPVFCPLSIDIPQQEWGDIGEFRARWMNLWLYRMLYRLYPLPWGAQGGPRSYYSVPSICFLFMEVRRWYLSFGVFNQCFFCSITMTK